MQVLLSLYYSLLVMIGAHFMASWNIWQLMVEPVKMSNSENGENFVAEV